MFCPQRRSVPHNLCSVPAGSTCPGAQFCTGRSFDRRPLTFGSFFCPDGMMRCRDALASKPDTLPGTLNSQSAATYFIISLVSPQIRVNCGGLHPLSRKEVRGVLAPGWYPLCRICETAAALPCVHLHTRSQTRTTPLVLDSNACVTATATATATATQRGNLPTRFPYYLAAALHLIPSPQLPALLASPT